MKGRPEVRVGHKVELLSEARKQFAQPMGFFVNAVTHDYDVDRGYFQTSLELVRGQARNGFIRPTSNGKADILEADRTKLTREITNLRSLTPAVSSSHPDDDRPLTEEQMRRERERMGIRLPRDR